MSRLLNLTIKINDRARYKNTPDTFGTLAGTSSRVIEIIPNSLEIKDQEGTVITELKKSSSFGNFSVGDIRNIKVSFEDLDIPISWAWGNKNADAEIEFTLKNLKYDQLKGFNFGNIGFEFGAVADTLFLNQSDFEIEVFESQERKTSHNLAIIELSERHPNIKKTFNDFRDLFWQITKAKNEEKFTDFIPALENYQTAVPASLPHQFYDLRNINDNSEGVKKICEDNLQIMRILNQWKAVGVKTLPESARAKKNGFDVINEPSLTGEISGGKYKGFPVTSLEEYDAIILIPVFATSSSSPPAEPKVETKKASRYNRNNIDTFRQFFINDMDRSELKYFRGFRPGDIKKNSDGKFVSFNHQADVRDKKNNEWEIIKGENFTRFYYELKAYWEEGVKAFEILKEALRTNLSEMPKTRKEVWDIYWGWIKQFWPHGSKDKDLKGYNRNLTELLPLLQTSFVNQNRSDCETALSILKRYETPFFLSPENQIKLYLSSEISAKKNEVEDRMKTIFSEEIDAAANEDYGSGSLVPEAKKIFTIHKAEIKSETIFAEIKGLIKLLVKAKKIIAEAKHLDQMVLANNIEREYQNGQGDKKTAYVIVNQVDNQWVDRTIANLGVIKKKNQQQVITERKKQLKIKYGNSVAVQVVFDSNVLDTTDALDEAEKLWIKVREAETKNDTDASLLTFLQDYQNAKVGTLNNKAWQAVNDYNKQGEAAIEHLQKIDLSREEIIKNLQETKNESELEIVYNRARENKLYKRGGKSKKVIDSLRQRKEILFKIEKENISPENKNFLQTVLSKMIPDTIKNDNDEQRLTELESKLKTFPAAESEEKGKIYQEYKSLIDQILTEISEEKQRFQKAKSDLGINESSDTESSPGRLLDWIWGPVIVGSIMAVGIIILVVIQNFRKSSKTE